MNTHVKYFCKNINASHSICCRLVVIADKNKVHSEFPIPLINRLEKHYVSATSLLSREQKDLKAQLEEWTHRFVTPQRNLQWVTSSFRKKDFLLIHLLTNHPHSKLSFQLYWKAVHQYWWGVSYRYWSSLLCSMLSGGMSKYG